MRLTKTGVDDDDDDDVVVVVVMLWCCGCLFLKIEILRPKVLVPGSNYHDVPSTSTVKRKTWGGVTAKC